MDKQKILELKAQVFDNLRAIEIARQRLQQLNQQIMKEEQIPDKVEKKE